MFVYVCVYVCVCVCVCMKRWNAHFRNPYRGCRLLSPHPRPRGDPARLLTHERRYPRSAAPVRFGVAIVILRHHTTRSFYQTMPIRVETRGMTLSDKRLDLHTLWRAGLKPLLKP